MFDDDFGTFNIGGSEDFDFGSSDMGDSNAFNVGGNPDELGFEALPSNGYDPYEEVSEDDYPETYYGGLSHPEDREGWGNIFEVNLPGWLTKLFRRMG